jgi:DNA-binding MarR family transcriptional regulator
MPPAQAKRNGKTGRAERPAIVLAAKQARGGPLQHVELRIWLRLLACSSKIENSLRVKLRREFGTSLSRFDVLAQLDRFPQGLTMSELSRLLMVTNGAVTGLVDSMLVEGLVCRRESATDRRAVHVQLTKAGRKAFLPMARRHEEWVVAMIGQLSATAQREILENLTLLKRHLDQVEDD